MSAYATLRKASVPQHSLRVFLDNREADEPRVVRQPSDPANNGGELIDLLIDRIADRLAAALAQRLDAPSAEAVPEWLDSRAAAAYLGLHRDTLRKLAAERTIPAEQDGPGCRLLFRRSELDDWRTAGGRSGRLAAVLPDAA
jgi:excisionase family DNA binding protein